MADKSRGLEFKVGIFVFIGIIICVWFILLIGDFKLIKVGYNIEATFGFANGIKVGAPVRLAGVDVGEVKEISLRRNPDTDATKIIIKAWVGSETEIPKDSRAWVNTLGLLGEKYLEIIPGTEFDKILKEGDVLVGEDPASIQEVTDLTKEIALQVQETLDGFQVALDCFQKTLGNMDMILEDMHEGRGTVGLLFTDDRLYNNIEEMFADLKKNPWKLLHKPKESR